MLNQPTALIDGKLAKFQITLPEPHAAQKLVIEEAKRFNVVACGRRFGKTVLGIDRMVYSAISGKPTAWFAPTYKQLAESWREVLRSLGKLVSRSHQTERRIELVTGGSVEFWSLDSPDVADSVRGRKYAIAIVDEAATVKDLIDVWQRVIRPTLADLRGSAWFLSTPRGYNGFQVLYNYGMDPAKTDWACWQMPTSSNPHIEPEEIEAMRQEMTEAAFEQEVLANFLSWEGAVFRRIAEAARCEPKDGPVPYRALDYGVREKHDYVIGCDWGRTNDFTVFVVIDILTKEMVWMERSNQIDYTVQRMRLAELNARWQPLEIIAESNSIGQPIIEQLNRDGLTVRLFNTTNATKATAIEALALAFERGEIGILKDPVLIAELQAFQSEVLPSGLIRYSAPAGMHDDCVMALAIAWQEVATSLKRRNHHVFRSESIFSLFGGGGAF